MQLVFDFPVISRYSFDNFVVCSGNRTAFEFARRLVDPAAGESVLYLHGAPGSGKTHLLAAVGHDQLGEGKLSCLSCSTLDLPAESGPSDTVSPFVAQLQGAPVLLIDDIDRLPHSRRLREEVWHLFNEFYGSGRRIVVTGSVPPRELTSVDAHLSSRLLWGLVACLDVSDDLSRRLILKKLAADRQIVLPDEVIEHLLAHTRRDLHSLRGGFEILARRSLATGRKISLRLARETGGDRPVTG